jgi:hypothetical protein
VPEHDPYSPIRGKCVWWREVANNEDLYDARLKDPQRRIECTCFVEGFRWEMQTAEVPPECPKSKQCRYYIKAG